MRYSDLCLLHDYGKPTNIYNLKLVSIIFISSGFFITSN